MRNCLYPEDSGVDYMVILVHVLDELQLSGARPHNQNFVGCVESARNLVKIRIRFTDRAFIAFRRCCGVVDIRGLDSRIVVNSFVHAHDSSFLPVNPDDSSMKARGNGVPIVSLLSYPRIYQCSHEL